MNEALTRCGEGYGSIVVREGDLGYYKTLKKSGGAWAWGKRVKRKDRQRICGLEGAERSRSFVAKGSWG
jgi:hypothetical protein